MQISRQSLKGSDYGEAYLLVQCYSQNYIVLLQALKMPYSWGFVATKHLVGLVLSVRFGGTVGFVVHI